MRQNYDIERRHELRDRSARMWPERAIGRDPNINLAEVGAALSHPRRRAPAKADQRRTPGYSGPPVDIGEPPMRDGKKLTYTQAAAMRGVSAAAMFKRVHRFGWSVAMNDLIRSKKENGTLRAE